MLRLKFYFVLLLCLLFAFPVFAQEEAQSLGQLIDFIEKTTGMSKEEIKSEISEMINQKLSDTKTLNKVVQKYAIDKAGFRFLKDVNFEFKTFSENRSDGIAALGFGYSYAKDLKQNFFAESAARSSGLSFSFQTEGNVAFNRALNPKDFLDSKFSLHLFTSTGGTVNKADSALATRLNRLEDILVEIDHPDSLSKSPAWKEFLNTVSARMSTQFYIDFFLSGGIESDQDFGQKQFAYGANLGLDLKAWNRSSTLAKANVLDWPFALVRILTGYDETFTPRGSVLPTIIFAIEQIDPQDDSIREIVDELSSFARFKGELGFKTPLGKTAHFGANLRYYRELGASSVIKNLKGDEFTYLTTAITMTNGMFVSYTTGKLPFDVRNDQIYEMGFQYKFK